MWARPDGERVLLAPTPEVAAFVGGVYGFDRVEIVDISVTFDGRRLALEAHLRPTGPGNTPSAR